MVVILFDGRSAYKVKSNNEICTEGAFCLQGLQASLTWSFAGLLQVSELRKFATLDLRVWGRTWWTDWFFWSSRVVLIKMRLLNGTVWDSDEFIATGSLISSNIDDGVVSRPVFYLSFLNRSQRVIVLVEWSAITKSNFICILWWKKACEFPRMALARAFCPQGILMCVACVGRSCNDWHWNSAGSGRRDGNLAHRRIIVFLPLLDIVSRRGASALI